MGFVCIIHEEGFEKETRIEFSGHFDKSAESPSCAIALKKKKNQVNMTEMMYVEQSGR